MVDASDFIAAMPGPAPNMATGTTKGRTVLRPGKRCPPAKLRAAS